MPSLTLIGITLGKFMISSPERLMSGSVYVSGADTSLSVYVNLLLQAEQLF